MARNPGSPTTGACGDLTARHHRPCRRHRHLGWPTPTRMRRRRRRRTGVVWNPAPAPRGMSIRRDFALGPYMHA
eukprot:365200-Chlamydomonas_euryale.AAC.6